MAAQHLPTPQPGSPSGPQSTKGKYVRQKKIVLKRLDLKGFNGVWSHILTTKKNLLISKINYGLFDSLFCHKFIIMANL